MANCILITTNSNSSSSKTVNTTSTNSLQTTTNTINTSSSTGKIAISEQLTNLTRNESTKRDLTSDLIKTDPSDEQTTSSPDAKEELEDDDEIECITEQQPKPNESRVNESRLGEKSIFSSSKNEPNDELCVKTFETSESTGRSELPDLLTKPIVLTSNHTPNSKTDQHMIDTSTASVTTQSRIIIF